MEVVRQPLRTRLPRAHGCVDDAPRALDGSHEGRGDRSATCGEREDHTRDRLGQALEESSGIGRREPSRITDYDHPPVGEERRCGESVEHETDVELFSTRGSVLLHDHGRVTILHQIFEKVVERLPDERRVVAAHQIRGDRRLSARGRLCERL